MSNRFDTNVETGAARGSARSIIVGRALQLKLITNPVQLELSRWLPRPAWHGYDNVLARCQIRYEANDAVRLFRRWPLLRLGIQYESARNKY